MGPSGSNPEFSTLCKASFAETMKFGLLYHGERHEYPPYPHRPHKAEKQAFA